MAKYLDLAALKKAFSLLKGDIDTKVGTKMDKFSIGTGLELKNGTMNVTLDTSIAKVVTTLPASPAAADVNKIHFVPSGKSGTNDIYSEYIWLSNKWEKIGDFVPGVDLSPYLTKTDAQNTYAKKDGTGATGTWNISINGLAGTATKLATARTLTIGSTAKSFDGSGNVAWTLAEIGAAAASHTHNYLPLSGGTLTGDLSIIKSDPYLTLRGTNTNDSSLISIIFYASDNSYRGYIRYVGNTSGYLQISSYGYINFMTGYNGDGSDVRIQGNLIATQNWVNAQGFLKSHQSLDHLIIGTASNAATGITKYNNFTVNKVYNSSGYPFQYGNTIRIGGDGCGELALEWSGVSTAVGRMYYRSLRDNTHSWSNWATIAYTTDIPSVGNGTITITQGGVSKGSFSVNQSGNTTIALDVAGSSSISLTEIEKTDSYDYPIYFSDVPYPDGGDYLGWHRVLCYNPGTRYLSVPNISSTNIDIDTLHINQTISLTDTLMDRYRINFGDGVIYFGSNVVNTNPGIDCQYLSLYIRTYETLYLLGGSSIEANKNITVSSDSRLKSDILEISNENLSKVDRVQYKSFNWKDQDNGPRQYGVIAQELLGLGIPGLVIEPKKEDGYYSVNYNGLYALEIANLKKQVRELKEMISVLSSKIS